MVLQKRWMNVLLLDTVDMGILRNIDIIKIDSCSAGFSACGGSRSDKFCSAAVRSMRSAFLLYRKCNVISCKEKKNVPWHILLSAAARSTQSAILLYTKCMFSRVYDFFSPVGQHDLRLHSARNLYVQQQFLSLIPPLADDFSPRRFVPCFCMSQ